MLKFTYRTLPLLLVLLLGSAGSASAQNLSAFFGVGTATDKSNGIVPNFSQDGTIGPKMTGTFGTFGAEFMVFKHLGIGGEYTAKFSQGDYSGLGYRPTFYDFNAIYQPISFVDSKVVPEFQGGIGGATMHFYLNQAFCPVSNSSCTNASQPLVNSNHFQLHGAAGVKLYVKGNIFIRPQIDLHYMTSYPEFGSKLVPQYTIAIGYTFGER